MIKTKDNIKEVNYRNYYFFGLIYISLGIILTVTVSPGFLGFMVFGLLFIFITIAYKNKWYDKNWFVFVLSVDN